MKTPSKVALVLALGLLVGGIGLAGAGPALSPASESPPVAQTDHCDVPPNHIAFGIAARWGFLNEPIYGSVHGEWTIGEEGDRGLLVGVWASRDGGVEGPFEGSWKMDPEGHGTFLGEWSDRDGIPNGTAAGGWLRTTHRTGMFRGHWNLSEERPGGPLAGEWNQTGEAGGTFRGKWFPARDAAVDRHVGMTPWDGFLSLTQGALVRAHAVRFETGGDYRWGTDDRLYERVNRYTVEWRSSTTGSWDGIVALAVMPKTHHPPAHLTLHTDQWSRTWEVSELPDPVLRERVDRAGNEIEVRVFRVDGVEPCRPDFVRFEMRLTWGILVNGPGEVSDAFHGWNGSLRVSNGFIRLQETLGFETGGEFGSGTDDRVLPRRSPQAVAWRSSTDGDGGGIAVTVLVPLHRGEPARVGFHTESWSGTWTLHELLNLDLWVEVDGLGNAIHIQSRRA